MPPNGCQSCLYLREKMKRTIRSKTEINGRSDRKCEENMCNLILRSDLIRLLNYGYRDTGYKE